MALFLMQSTMSSLTVLIYVFLFAVLLAEPHIIKGHIAGLNAPVTQSVVTFIVVGIAVLVYWLHQRDIKTREKQKQLLKEENATAVHHLTDLSAELGVANRRLPLLRIITTDLLKKGYNSENNRRAIIEELLTTAVVSLSQTEWGVFRFVDIERGRTVGEFKFVRNTKNLPSSVIGNKVLIDWHRKSDNLPKEAQERIFATVDKSAPIKCHYIIPENNQTAKNNQHVIQNIVDQAQLVYKYLYQYP